MNPEEYLIAEEAARLLGVKPQTLYAYVSRGLLTSVPGEQGRARRYLRAEIERLRRGNRNPRITRALDRGEPLIESEVGWITAEGPVYRGRPALQLAGTDTPFESAAELLWTGTLLDGPDWSSESVPVPPHQPVSANEATPIAALIGFVAKHLLADPTRFGTDPHHVLPRARTLIRQMAAASAGSSTRFANAQTAPTVAEVFLIAAGLTPSPTVSRAINRALVMVADHELNPSTFAVRVAASTGSDIYACVVAGLAVLSGPRHGGASERIGALLDEVSNSRRTDSVVTARIRRGEVVPGFGHPLYPDGDPRAGPLLSLAGDLGPGKAPVVQCVQLVEVMDRAGLDRPNLDLGLVALVSALDLPPVMAGGLFALGRTAGWVAHAIEQYQTGSLIRPRAARAAGP
jgi:citrate synthase